MGRVGSPDHQPVLCCSDGIWWVGASRGSGVVGGAWVTGLRSGVPDVGGAGRAQVGLRGDLAQRRVRVLGDVTGLRVEGLDPQLQTSPARRRVGLGPAVQRDPVPPAQLADELLLDLGPRRPVDVDVVGEGVGDPLREQLGAVRMPVGPQRRTRAALRAGDRPGLVGRRQQRDDLTDPAAVVPDRPADLVVTADPATDPILRRVAGALARVRESGQDLVTYYS